MKNRTITEAEIINITKECKIREKAFFTIMRQSGLPPRSIKKLRIGDLESILSPNTPIPCKIEVPNKTFPIFIGEEAVQYLKQYLEIREIKEQLTPTSLLFTAKKNPNKEINTKDESIAFARIAQKLRRRKEIRYESGTPSELRLTSLTQFYQRKAKNYLTELRKKSVPKDNEFYRKLYEEIAMPSLEIETPTTMEIHQLRKQHKQLQNKLRKIEDIILSKEIEYEISPEEMEEILRQIEWEKEHPEEAQQLEEKVKEAKEKWEKHVDKYLEEHPEIKEQRQKEHIQLLETRINELEKTTKKIKETIQNQQS